MRKLLTLCAAAALSIGGIGITAAQEYGAGQEAAAGAEAEADASAELSIMTGESIYNLQGEEIGTVEEVSLDAEGNQQAVVSVGEFLGLGGKQVLIPAEELSARAEGGYTVNYTQEQLEQMPEYEASEN